jgi:hypothetical protein
MVRCRSLSFIISCCQRDKDNNNNNFIAIGYRLSAIDNWQSAAGGIDLGWPSTSTTSNSNRMSSHGIHPGIRTKSKLIEITNNLYKLLQIDPNEYKSDPKKYKSVQKTTNRTELLQIDPKNYKSNRTTTNRSKKLQIEPNHYKSNRTTTNRNRSKKVQIDPKKYKSIQKSTNRSDLKNTNRTEPLQTASN